MHSVLDFFQDGVLSFCVSVFKTENPVRQTVNKISVADYNKSSPNKENFKRVENTMLFRHVNQR